MGIITILDAAVPEVALDKSGAAGLRRVDIVLVDGKVASIGPAGTAQRAGARAVDVKGAIVLPAFVDMHTHLDKGHIWPRRQNPDGTWLGALDAVLADREANWAAEDVERRMNFALECAYSNGTAAIRTHLNSAPPQHEVTWDVFSRVREEWAGRIELQAVSIVGPETCLDPAALDTVACVVKRSGGVLGGSIAVDTKAREAVFAVIEKAGELGLAVDLHIDETLDPESSALRHLADAVIETDFKGPVVAGHCCVLSVQDERVAMETIDRVAEAGISVVSLPICNMYLMDRDPSGTRTPRYRGVTLIKELRAAGVPVAIASDNTRDPFYAYGDLDMFEVFREGARIMHFDHPQSDAWTWARAVSSSPAAICGFKYNGLIEVGADANLILFRARSWTELLSRPYSDRHIIRGETSIKEMAPEYNALDDLMGVS